MRNRVRCPVILADKPGLGAVLTVTSEDWLSWRVNFGNQLHTAALFHFTCLLEVNSFWIGYSSILIFLKSFVNASIPTQNFECSVQQISAAIPPDHCTAIKDSCFTPNSAPNHLEKSRKMVKRMSVKQIHVIVWQDFRHLIISCQFIVHRRIYQHIWMHCLTCSLSKHYTNSRKFLSLLKPCVVHTRL